MGTVYEDLKNKICKDCGNLHYYDWYFCKHGLHQNKDEKLSARALKRCTKFEDRGFGSHDFCQTTRCVFWCRDCEKWEDLCTWMTERCNTK